MICYITFTSDNSSIEYAYQCGSLRPEPGDLIVIGIGNNNHLKIVSCTKVSEDDDPHATKEIFGIVQVQPTSGKGDKDLVRP